MRIHGIVAFMLLTSGCYAIHATAIGPKQPAKPPLCPIEFGHQSPQALPTTHEQVGAICFAGQDADTVYRKGMAQDDVRAEACRLGGQLLAPSGTCSSGKMDGTEFGVWRAKLP